MALKVKGSFDLNTGIQLTETYARVDTALSLSGEEINAYPLFWANEQAWNERKSTLNPFGLDADFTYAYNREVDGTDILMFANQKVADTLELLGYEVIITNI